jgi:outer membrane immunogenic protein
LPVLSDRGLLFLTGGLAAAGISSSGSVDLANSAAFATWGGSNSSTRTGYTVGGGLEYAWADHWTTKAEYLWYDLGRISHPLNCTAMSSGGCSFVYSTLGNTVSSVRGSIVRVGLNYRFNWGPIVGEY